MPINDADRTALLDLARRAVEAEVCRLPRPTVTDPSELLSERRGCFVTLTNAGMLRGCIGTFQPDRPLGEMIVEMGNAAAHDPRFTGNPITPGELPHLTVEVSVLSPLEPTDDPAALTIGEHGIYIQSGYRSGCFLPEVATDQGWTAEEFLNFCCSHKAGLPENSWRKPDTKVYLFTSEKIK